MKAKMLSILGVFFLTMMWIPVSAQISDDFSDGNFTENPAWTGTDSIFKVNSDRQLQLNATVGGKASLFIQDANNQFNPNDTEHNIEWHFWIKEAFAPSSKNYTDIYLCDNYFLRLGEAGSDDVVDLHRVDTTGAVSICRGHDTFISSPFLACFKVIRKTDGAWQIYADKTGVGNYLLEAECVDTTYFPSGDFGMEITFSKTNAQKVYLDNVYIGPEIIDDIPPALANITVLNYNQLHLQFSEDIVNESALNSANYHVNNQLDSPEIVEFLENKSNVILTFLKTINEDVLYTLTIFLIEDNHGNQTENIQCPFLYHTIHENDLVINEIMADPDPAVGLPAYEYIELYNTSEYPINLNGWSVKIGNSEKTFTGDYFIKPDSYLILCKSDAVEELSNYGYCYGFQSFSITNGGTIIELKDTDNNSISNVEFSLSWYGDKDKSEGGWSLEQIDPNAPCAGADNWRASADNSGGTPGEINSIFSNNPVAPKIDFINVLSDNIIEVVFDQKMDANTLKENENYTVIEFDAHPDEIIVENDDTKKAELHFYQYFGKSRIYTIEVNNITNCSGIPLPPYYRLNFGIPDNPAHQNIIINEILFDPIEPAGDFIEIYNRSDKIINLSKLKIGVIKSTFPNPPDTTMKQICTENRLFLPDSMLLLTTTAQEIGRQYECATDNYIEMQSFPQYPNSGASIILMHDTEVIDVIDYSEKDHYPLLTETKGVSLERIGNGWISSAAPLYGTPGYSNSSVVDERFYGDNSIEITPKVFSPDGDGFDDIATIFYKFSESGYTIKIIVFDSYGRFVRQLSDNSLASTQGYYVWDGLDDNHQLVTPGIYVIFTEIFNLEGNVKRYKAAVAVVSK